MVLSLDFTVACFLFTCVCVYPLTCLSIRMPCSMCTIYPVSHVQPVFPGSTGAHTEYVDYILVPFSLGPDKRGLTLILSRRARISSTPCHQSSEPNVKVPSAGSLADCIPSIMYVYPGESCQQCHHGFYQKKRSFGPK